MVCNLFVFAVDEHRCALPAQSVERVVPMVYVTPLASAPDVVLGVIDVHGRTVPVLNLRLRLGLPPRAARLDDLILLVRSARRRWAVPVDGVAGLFAYDSDELEAAEEAVTGARHLTGIAKLGDGIVFVHDLDAFVSLEEDDAVDLALAGSDAAPAADSDRG